jgi:hypothetical protein
MQSRRVSGSPSSSSPLKYQSSLAFACFVFSAMANSGRQWSLPFRIFNAGKRLQGLMTPTNPIVVAVAVMKLLIKSDIHG